MQLNEDLMYRAVSSRDRRFDGRFFTAVTSTGIYCRPICPARTPLRRHVRFYPCAAAAEEAGFRPCRRCRPDSAPGSPAWVGSSATVTRGLRCISQGALDSERVEELAERLGLGERQLRRLFLRHLGASPGALARTRRVHFARQLIDETEMPMTEVALAAGFSSLRQFNAAVKETFGFPPTALRARSGSGAGAGEWLTLRLPFRPPYQWNALISFLSRRAIPGVESVTADRYARCVEADDGPHRVEVRPAEDAAHLLLRIRPSLSRGLIELSQRVRALFDCDADPLPTGEVLGRDPVLSRLVRARPGLRVPGAWDGFELAVRAILGQQVTVAGATTLAGRMVRSYGQPCSGGGEGITHHFPTPDRLADADVARMGMPRQRAEAIRALAREVASGRISLAPSSGEEEPRQRLREIPGLGPWTEAYIAMRALRDPDALPAGDLALRKSLAEGGILPSAEAVLRRAESWRPWRAYAVIHLWTEEAVSSPAPSSGKQSSRKQPGRKHPVRK